MIEQLDREEAHINTRTFLARVMKVSSDGNGHLAFMHHRNIGRIGHSTCWLYFQIHDVNFRESGQVTKKNVRTPVAPSDNHNGLLPAR